MSKTQTTHIHRRHAQGIYTTAYFNTWQKIVQNHERMFQVFVSAEAKDLASDLPSDLPSSPAGSIVDAETGAFARFIVHTPVLTQP